MPLSWRHFCTNSSPLTAGMQDSMAVYLYLTSWAKQKHLKHNTYLWQKFGGTRMLCDSHSSFQIPKMLLLELQPHSFARLYSYSDTHGLTPKKNSLHIFSYIYSTSSLQISSEETLITAIQSTGDLFLKEKSFWTGKKTSRSGFSGAGGGLSGFPVTYPKDIIFRLCWVPSC